MNNQEDIAIKVEGVDKDFDLPHEAQNSLKTRILHPMSKGKNIEKQHALKDISFEIKKGEFFGIVGRNGSGKSTLLKILAGIYTPTKGKVTINGSLTPFIELGVGFNPELTGRENVYLNGAMLGFNTKEMEEMYNEIVEFAELEKFMDQKLKNYSSGMQVRLAFSVAIRAKSDILLLDEVLAVGDADFQRKCFSYFKKLKKDSKTVVLVTHSMDSVREFCDKALLIDSSSIVTNDSPIKVAAKYSKLFLDSPTVYKTTEKYIGERWGTGYARYSKIKSYISGKDIIVAATIKTVQPIDRALYGIHISSEDGVEVTALNNRMIQVDDIVNLNKGSELEIKWALLNIFNDGKYYVTLTIVDDSSNTLDWFTEACSFTIKRADRSTTSVIPPVKVSVIRKK